MLDYAPSKRGIFAYALFFVKKNGAMDRKEMCIIAHIFVRGTEFVIISEKLIDAIVNIALMIKTK